RKLLVPVEMDTYLSVFQPNEQLTITEIMTRLDKDPQDRNERHRVLSALNYRSRRGGRLQRSQEGRRGQDSVWKRTGEQPVSEFWPCEGRCGRTSSAHASHL